MPFGHPRPTRTPAPGSARAAGGREGRTGFAAQASRRFRSPAGTGTVRVLPGGGKGQMK